jgi:hypothetical protein
MTAPVKAAGHGGGHRVVPVVPVPTHALEGWFFPGDDSGAPLRRKKSSLESSTGRLSTRRPSSSGGTIGGAAGGGDKKTPARGRDHRHAIDLGGTGVHRKKGSDASRTASAAATAAAAIANNVGVQNTLSFGALLSPGALEEGEGRWAARFVALLLVAFLSSFVFGAVFTDIGGASPQETPPPPPAPALLGASLLLAS